MKITGKRMASLFLALTLTLSLAAPALAADTLPTVPKGYSITLVKEDISSYFDILFHDGVMPVLVGYDETNAYLTTEGKVLRLPNARGFASSEGMIPFMVDDAAGAKIGYMDKTGKVLIPAKYDAYEYHLDYYTGFFIKGNALVFQKTGTDEDGNPAGTWSQIDKTGKKVPTTLKADFENFCGTMGDEAGPTETVKINGEDQDVRFNEGYALIGANGAQAGAAEDYHYYILKKDGAAPTVPAPTVPVAPAAVTAAPTASPVTLNGKPVTLEAYNIESNNYFMLRDIASILSGTDKQFDVSYDKEKKAVVLTSKTAYTPVGGELAAGSGKAQSGVKNATPILKDGAEIALTAYTIHGNNFFKLRDLGQAFDFGVDYDKATKSVCIDSAKGYTAEK